MSQEKQDEIKPARDEKGRLLPGNTANPKGRPKGKTLKDFAREFYMNKTEEEKIEYIETVEKAKPGFSWQMAEGNPKQDTESNIKVELPTPILDGLSTNNSNEEDS